MVERQKFQRFATTNIPFIPCQSVNWYPTVQYKKSPHISRWILRLGMELVLSNLPEFLQRRADKRQADMIRGRIGPSPNKRNPTTDKWTAVVINPSTAHGRFRRSQQYQAHAMHPSCLCAETEEGSQIHWLICMRLL